MKIAHYNARLRTLVLFAVITVVHLLTGCGGGGGGSGGGSGGGVSSAGLTLSTSAVTFESFASDQTFDTKIVQVSWSNSNVAGIAIGTPPGQSLPNWLQVDLQGNSSPISLTLRRAPNWNLPGHYSTTIRVVSGNANGDLISQLDINVSFDIVAMPNITPGTVSMSWVESEAPDAQTLAITLDSRVHLVNTSLDINSLGMTTTGNALTIASNAQSRSQSPGTQNGNLTLTFGYNSAPQRTIIVPVTATVRKALNGPASITTEVNASTRATDLNGLLATVSAATQTGLQFTAQSNVPWLAVSGSPTGSVNNLALSLKSSELSKMSNGIYAGTITLTATTSNISPLQIPVSLNLRLPEVNFVAPVAFSDTVASDYIIVRGEGFDNPDANVYIGGQAISGASKISDTEIRVVPGARIAGNYQVEVSNMLDIKRNAANLRVADPPAYANYSMSAPIGHQQRIISSPVNNMVFSVMCFFCQASPAGTPSTVQRFTYNPGSLQWVRTQYSYPRLYDIAMTPDETALLVLTETQLLIVDPLTMATTKTIDLPWQVASSSPQLAVTNNGLVFIQDIEKAYSMHTESFIPIDGLYFHSGISGSLDGSRAIFGEMTNSGATAYRYYDSSTGNVILSTTFEYYISGSYSRHAEKVIVLNMVLDSNLALLGTLPVMSVISPDGNRAYGLELSTNPIQLRSFDVSTKPFVELFPATPLSGVSGLATIAVDPRGKHAFITSESMFVVVNVH
jgi:hypothetical protein